MGVGIEWYIDVDVRVDAMRVERVLLLWRQERIKPRLLGGMKWEGADK